MKSNLLTPVAIICIHLFILLFPDESQAQLQRERVVTDDPVANIFQATTNIGISTVRNPAARNLNTSILHTFGLVNGGIDRFYGMDDGANTRLALEYGISDRFSVGIGRMTFQKVVDVRSKYNILRQTTSGSTPLELAVKASTGITTLPGREFSDRLNYFGSVMIARKFSNLSLQISPMYAYFKNVSPGNHNQLFGLGVAAEYKLNERFSLSAEYLPVLSESNPLTNDTIAVALNIDTGGHIFQIFFTSSQWHNEQYIMANNRHQFLEGDLRFGFHIHRVFGL